MAYMFRKKPLQIPDPGQQVRLLMRRGRWRGRWRAISEPSTDARGEVVIWVAPEWKYQDALREEQRAIGIPWPVEQLEILSPSEPLDVLEMSTERPGRTDAPETATSPETAASHRSWWRRFFGVE